MTAFFTAATAACLITLAVVAVNVNDSARSRQSDQQLAATASRLASAATYGDGAFRFDEDLQVQFPPTDQPAAFVDEYGVELASPDQAALPATSVIQRLYAAAHASQVTVYTTADGPNGSPYRWAATPLHSTAEGPAVIVGAAVSDPAEQRRFLETIGAAVIGLTLLAAAAGHLLSGIAMRPALTRLRQQEQFLREAAHELRTPLAAVRMALQTAHHADAGTARDAILRAERRVDGLSTLVTGLLMRARSDTAGEQVELRRIRLDQVVDVAVDELGSDRVVVAARPAVVLGSPELITHAVRNLVENALRYSDGPVSVTVSDGRFVVSDSGPGLSAEARARTADPAFGVGTGSGLPIVRWIAAVHGGSLHLDTAASGGLAATVSFAR